MIQSTSAYGRVTQGDRQKSVARCRTHGGGKQSGSTGIATRSDGPTQSTSDEKKREIISFLGGKSNRTIKRDLASPPFRNMSMASCDTLHLSSCIPPPLSVSNHSYRVVFPTGRENTPVLTVVKGVELVLFLYRAQTLPWHIPRSR